MFISWTAPGDDGDQGTAQAYDIRYATSTIKSKTWNQAVQVLDEPMPVAAGSQQTYAIAGLLANTKYWVGLKTEDEAGNVSNLSNTPNSKTAKNKIKKVKVKLKLQGRSNYSTTLQFQLFRAATEVEVDNKTGQSNNLGEDEISSLNLEADYYDAQISVPYYLTKKNTNILIEADETEIDFGLLNAGNLWDQDNVIDDLDWQVMRADWGVKTGASDINQDSIINSIDWSILSDNWGAVGD